MPDCPRCGEMTKKAAQWHQRMLIAKSRIVQLEAALAKYGRHTGSGSLSGCQFGKSTNRNNPCTCGLDTTLRGTPNG